MLCSSPWATKHSHKSSFHIQRVSLFIFYFWNICPLACRTGEFVIHWRGKQSELNCIIYLIPRRGNSILLHGVCLPKCSMKSYQFKYTGMVLAIVNACPVVMHVVRWKSENFAVYYKPLISHPDNKICERQCPFYSVVNENTSPDADTPSPTQWSFCYEYVNVL